MEKAYVIMEEFERSKKSHGLAMLLHLFGFGRLYLGHYGIFAIFFLSLFVYVGVFRRIVDFFLVWQGVSDHNKKLLEHIKRKYDLLSKE